MNKRKIETLGKQDDAFLKFKSYSIDEIMAAGGPTAFAEKMGKSWESLIANLEKLPKDAFLTDEEFEEAMKTLNQSK